jgi:hypothetical protein
LALSQAEGENVPPIHAERAAGSVQPAPKSAHQWVESLVQLPTLGRALHAHKTAKKTNAFVIRSPVRYASAERGITPTNAVSA